MEKSRYQSVTSISDELTLEDYELSAQAYHNLSSNLLALVAPGLKIATGYSISSALNMTPKALEMYQQGTLTSGVIALSTGILAYAAHKYVGSFDIKFDSMLTDNIHRKLTDYEQGDVELHKLYVQKVFARNFSYTFRSLLSDLKNSTRSLGATISYFTVDQFISDTRKKLSSKMNPAFANDDTGARALFIAHVLGELNKDNSLTARRMKEEKIFQREVIKDFMDDSEKFVNEMASNLPSISEVGKVILRSLGPDARFVLSDLKKYSDGQKSYFAMELDILEHATQQAQIENIYKEFATRVVNTMISAANDLLTPETLDKEKARFRQFKALKGDLDDNDDLIKLSRSAEQMIDKIATSVNNRGSREVVTRFNRLLHHQGVISSKIDFSSMKKDSAAYSHAVDAVVRMYRGKDVRLDKTFMQQFAESALKIVEKRVRARADAKLSPDKIDKMDIDTLKEITQKFGLKATDSITPTSATQKVMDRVKARIYFEMYQKEMKKGFTDAGLDFDM